jgi:CTP:molybdopterin cytidylyltransferase MocA
MSTVSKLPHSLNVVVLAAGKGERFLAEGVTVPKPLISWKGRTLLDHTLDVAQELAHPDGRIIVVATDAVASPAHRALKDRGVAHYCRVVAVSVVQPGPAASAQLALAHLPLDEPVAFMDCDNHYAERGWIRVARDLAARGEGFMTVAAHRPGLVREDYCNVTIASDGAAAEVIEKVDLGPDAALGTGIYGFHSAAYFAGAMSWQTPKAPMSVVCKIAAPVPMQTIVVEGWQPLGTPAQMAAAK